MAELEKYAGLAGSVLKGIGQASTGLAADKSARQEARGLKKRAGQTRASSQREGIAELRDARYVMSTLRARAAGSGAGASDPTIVNLLADIEAAGEYNSLSAMFDGESEAQADEAAAKARRAEGRAAKRVGIANSAVTILDGALDFAGKYG